jgi:hypothetical protein
VTPDGPPLFDLSLGSWLRLYGAHGPLERLAGVPVGVTVTLGVGDAGPPPPAEDEAKLLDEIKGLVLGPGTPDT